ncbi:hypothetical protein PS685_04732 [Pseudomonas fluorescens]|uniref:Uncharacterized protein n=1 Tax=Pseudomonas fluorescens TaxID=294 RepID=A0A5E6ZHH1_PSEFL|nr:hypothetical protein PS685_04732 [Pseudomonas fluorescens]
MDHHLDLFRACIKQPAGLDQLQAFVHHAGRIYRNLAPHRPIGMSTGLIRRDVFKLCQRRLTEWTTRGCQQNPTNTDITQATGKVPRQALENRVVFAVDGQQYRTAATHGLHKQVAGHHQRFFVGQQDLLAGIDRRQCRAQACGTDNCRHHRIHFRSRRNLTQALLTYQYFGIEPGCAQIRL